MIGLLVRPADWVDEPTVVKLDSVADARIADAVCAEITALQTYGCRRADALVSRTRSLMGLRLINRMRTCRVMKQQGLLHPKSSTRSDSRRAHDGEVMAEESSQRWCSDNFEIAYDNGEVVTGVFMKDCRDREIIASCAWIGRGLPGEPVREIMIDAVETRFGSTDERAITVEFLSDNGGASRAIETHALVHELGIQTVHTPLDGPQSNGMAEGFVNTFKRDYVGGMNHSSDVAVPGRLPDAFRHFNEVHLHSALGHKS